MSSPLRFLSDSCIACPDTCANILIFLYYPILSPVTILSANWPEYVFT
jgi:hypothetical protein